MRISRKSAGLRHPSLLAGIRKTRARRIVLYAKRNLPAVPRCIGIRACVVRTNKFTRTHLVASKCFRQFGRAGFGVNLFGACVRRHKKAAERHLPSRIYEEWRLFSPQTGYTGPRETRTGQARSQARAGVELPAKASSNAAEQVVDESRNASLIALTSDEAGVRWEMLQEVQEKMFKDAEEETMNPRARNSDTREVGEINSLNRVNLRENTLSSRWADDVQRFERIDNRVGTGDAAVFFVW
jgi:hypothetical protein